MINAYKDILLELAVEDPELIRDFIINHASDEWWIYRGLILDPSIIRYYLDNIGSSYDPKATYHVFNDTLGLRSYNSIADYIQDLERENLLYQLY